MTPTPLILLVWGILLAIGILPNRILAFRVPATAVWRRARRVIGVAAILSTGFWLALDLTLPLLWPSTQFGGRLADAIGWASLLVAAVIATWLIVSRRPTSDTTVSRS